MVQLIAQVLIALIFWAFTAVAFIAGGLWMIAGGVLAVLSIIATKVVTEVYKEKK